MGRIRTMKIKSMASSLVGAFPDDFGTDFTKNKEKLSSLVKISSKKTKNVIAGYITHLQEKKEKLNTLKITYQAPLPDKRRPRGRR